MSACPVIQLDSVRGQILLWVSTDPPRTWTDRGLIQELGDMGHPPESVRTAIGGLRQRGLLYPRPFSQGECVISATVAGFRAVRANLFGGRAAAASDQRPWPPASDPGPWVWIEGEGWISEDDYEARSKGDG